MDALLLELELRKDQLAQAPIETIYFGGGTPSLLSLASLERILATIHTHYTVVANPEITLEANPDDLIQTAPQDIQDTGINRLSIGIQSFFDADLQGLHRAHDAQDAKKCLAQAAKHFDNISIDLIYGIPKMSVERWSENLEMALSFGVSHVSSYALTVESKTALSHFIKQGTYPAIDDHLAWQHFNRLIDILTKRGFVHYETSNFGKPHYFSKHNTAYWQGVSYMGVGPSAHSFIGNERSWNVSNNSIYIKKIQNNSLPSTVERLSKKARFNESIMLGLRTMWGISIDKIRREFPVRYVTYLQGGAQKFINQGLLEYNAQNDHLVTTPKGKFLIDGIAAELFMI